MALYVGICFGYNLIGDIHGEHNCLIKLKESLGYSQINDVYKHPSRKAIFLGDLVDRGKDVRAVLKLVKAMYDAGEAEVIIGNHEFNLVSYYTKNAAGAWLRSHIDRNYKQLEATILDFKGFEDELANYIEWFKTLPLYIEKEGFRVIHASWSDKYIQFLKSSYPENRLTYDFLVDANVRNSTACWAIEFLLKGLEIQLDGVVFYDSENIARTAMRGQWLLNPIGKRLHEVLLKKQTEVEDFLIPESN